MNKRSGSNDVHRRNDNQTFSGVRLVAVAALFIFATVPVSAEEASLSFAERLTAPATNVAQVAAAKSSGTPTHRKKTGTSAHPNAIATAMRAAFGNGVLASDRRPTGGPLLTDAQQIRLNALGETPGVSLEARFNSGNGTVAFLKPHGGGLAVRSLSQTGASSRPDDVANAFLLENSDLLRIDHPDSEMSIAGITNDAQGKAHLRYQQVHNGVPIWSREAMVHLDEQNNVYLFNGTYQPSLKGVDTTPTISADDALAAVRDDLNVNTTVAPEASPELVLFPASKGAVRLSYKVNIRPTLDQRWIYFIDAADGTVVHRIKNIDHAGTPATATSNDLNGQTRNFNVWLENGLYNLIDPTTPTNDAPHDPINQLKSSGDTYILDAQNGDGSQISFVQNATANGGWDPASVSAAFNTRAVYDYYKNTFQRDSIDGNGMNLIAVVHYENNYNNANWNGVAMIYGDGDGTTFSPLSGSLDVAAHEMTHGVTEHTAALIYEAQSGALNESFSDVFAAMVDSDDWLIGEDITVATPGYLRNMQDPSQGLTPQPTQMSEYQNLPLTDSGDNGGVHVNSGIPNRAAYLLAEGLSAEGLGTSIGRAETEKVYYRALTTYLTSSSKFIDARRALIQAAEDLYGVGSNEAIAVALSWDSVGVTEGSGSTSSGRTPTDAISGQDVVVYLYPTDGVLDDSPGEYYNVFAQHLDSPFTGYDPNTDIPLGNTISASGYTRPAAITTDTGTAYAYIANDYNLYAVAEANLANHVQVTTTGDIWSMAVSPDDRYFAYTTTSLDDNHIYLLDTSPGGTLRAIPIVSPDYQQGTTAGNTVLYADALAFDFTSNTLTFDALNCFPLPDDPCTTAGGGYQYWSVGLLDVASGQVSFMFPAQNPEVDTAFPTFASNNSFVVAFDLLDYSNVTTTGNVLSMVVTVDLETQTPNLVGTTGNGPYGVYGVPSFWGADDFITVQVEDAIVGMSTMRIPIDANWAGDPASAEWINDYAAGMPFMHRKGVRMLHGGLSSNRSLLDFGDVPSNGNATRTITLTNNADRDITLSNVTVNNPAFTSNAVNGLIARGASIKVAVSFKPGATSGTTNGTITFHSDGDPANLAVSLTANVLAAGGGAPATGGGGGGTGGGGGGGCAALNAPTTWGDAAILLFLVFAPLLCSIRRQLMNVGTRLE